MSGHRENLLLISSTFSPVSCTRPIVQMLVTRLNARIFSTILATVRKIELDLQSERDVTVHSSLTFWYLNESDELGIVRIGQHLYLTGKFLSLFFPCEFSLMESCAHSKFLPMRNCLTKMIMFKPRTGSSDTHKVHHIFENIKILWNYLPP